MDTINKYRELLKSRVARLDEELNMGCPEVIIINELRLIKDAADMIAKSFERLSK